jgi:hypothetical protein
VRQRLLLIRGIFFQQKQNNANFLVRSTGRKIAQGPMDASMIEVRGVLYRNACAWSAGPRQ